MLVLISFVLVFVAAITLVYGIVDGSSLTLIWVSIASSVTAGLVLVAAVVTNRPKVATADEGTGDVDEPPRPAKSLAATELDDDALPLDDEDILDDDDLGAGLPLDDGDDLDGDLDGDLGDFDDEDDDDDSAATLLDDDDDFFPIADYDDLRVNEIVPLLPELDDDELELVRAREEKGSGRKTVLSAIDDLLAEAAPLSDDDLDDDLGDDLDGDLDGDLDDDGPAGDEWGASDHWDGEGGDDDFPIAEYDDLNANEIIPLLDELTDDELEQVRQREAEGKNRVTIQREIDDILGPPPAKKKKAAAKKKPAAKKKKAAAKKKPAAKKKKAAAKKKPAAKKKKAAARKR